MITEILNIPPEIGIALCLVLTAAGSCKPEDYMSKKDCERAHEEHAETINAKLKIGTDDRVKIREELKNMRSWNKSLTGILIATVIAAFGYLLVNGTFAKSTELAKAEASIGEIKADIKVIKISQGYQEKAFEEIADALKQIRNGQQKGK